jgi:hypothetical protein
MSTKKNSHRFMAACLAHLGVTAIFLAGCSSSGSSNPRNTPAPSAAQSSDEFRPPVRGETMDEVHAQYDDPDQVFQTSDGGETWVYVFGKAKQFIPFYGPFADLRTLTIQFDESGRVSSWESGTHHAF